MYKKIAIATVITAPILAQIAAHFTQSSVPPATVPPIAVAMPAPVPTKPAAPSVIHYSPIVQPGAGGAVMPAGPMDTSPTLDPGSIAAAAMDMSASAPPPPALAAISAPAPDSEHVRPKPPEGPERF